jgi:putative transposase
LIHWLKAELPIEWLARRLEVSRSGYYAWRAAQIQPSNARQRRDALIPLIEGAFAASRSAAGARKIRQMLRRAHGITVNRKLIARIMRQEGLIPLQVIRNGKKRAARQGRAQDPVDLLNRDFGSSAFGAKLVGDITEVKTGEGKLYLATVIDLATREVIGYAIDTRMTTTLIIAAFTDAKRRGQLVGKAIFHSDHGTQYASKRFAKYCRRNKITRSMGAKLECWDNAVAESFFSALKQERLHAIRFATRAHAAAEMIDYIRYYNEYRPHGTLGGNTPTEHRAWLQAAA